jgi:hypothetical protein
MAAAGPCVEYGQDQHEIRGIVVSETDRWLSDYGASHSDIRNPGIYWLSVPILVLGTVGILWSLPVPEEFARISPVLNWGSVFLMAAVVYYFIISIPLAIGMLPFVAGITAIQGFVVVADRYFGRHVCGQRRRPLSRALREGRSQGGIQRYSAHDDRACLAACEPLQAPRNTDLNTASVPGKTRCNYLKIVMSGASPPR